MTCDLLERKGPFSKFICGYFFDGLQTLSLIEVHLENDLFAVLDYFFESVQILFLIVIVEISCRQDVEVDQTLFYFGQLTFEILLRRIYLGFEVVHFEKVCLVLGASAVFQ